MDEEKTLVSMKGESETKKYHFFAQKTMTYAPTPKCNYLEDLLDFIGATNQKQGMK